jgi:hypothetical protein
VSNVLLIRSQVSLGSFDVGAAKLKSCRNLTVVWGENPKPTRDDIIWYAVVGALLLLIGVAVLYTSASP